MLGSGIFEGFYKPQLKKFRANEYYKILLINVNEFLTNYDGFELSKSNSSRDKEWLIFPATEIKLNFDIVEYSAILDGGCFQEIESFKELNE